MLNDAYGFTDACHAAYSYFRHPEDVLISPQILPESKKKLQEEVEKLGPAGLKARAEKRTDRGGDSAMQPFDDTTPYFYLICEGDPSWVTDKSGKITGVDAAKTKFVGRPEDHAILAYAYNMLYDINGDLAGRAVSGVFDTSTGYMLWTKILGNEGRFNKNPQGKVDITFELLEPLSKYWIERQGSSKETPPQDIARYMYRSEAWDLNMPKMLVNFYYERAKSVLESRR